MKNFTLFRKLVFIGFLLLSQLAFSQDPPQYGTPFSGVPDIRDVSIYQVNMRCFSSAHNFQGVINRLDNIKALGVNVIYLMPFYPVGTDSKSVNSPYCIKDLTSVGSEFGTLANLRTLVDGAHSRGMAVIIDWVANQTSWDHPWITAHKDWYNQDSQGNIVQLGSYADVAALNFSNASMCSAMIDAMRFWVFTANIDGFRCDYANNSPVSFWTQAISNLRSIGTHNLIFFAEGDRSGNYTAGFDYNFSWNFYNNMKSIKAGSAATLIDNSNTFDYNGATGNQQVVRWLSNHDIYGSEGSPYTIFGGKAGVMASFVVSAYMKGIPFIYNGMEVGNTVSMTFPFTSGYVNWTQDVTVTPEMTKIINFRNTSNAIRRGTLTSYDNTDICAFKKEIGTESVFVVVNLRNASKTFTLPAGIANTTMYDAFTNAEVTLGSSVSLSAYQYLVYTPSLATDVPSISYNDDLLVYPNPVVHGIITVKLPQNVQKGILEILDLTGRQVFTAKIENQEQTFTINNLLKGIYILKVNSSLGLKTQKLEVQ